LLGEKGGNWWSDDDDGYEWIWRECWWCMMMTRTMTTTTTMMMTMLEKGEDKDVETCTCPKTTWWWWCRCWRWNAERNPWSRGQVQRASKKGRRWSRGTKGYCSQARGGSNWKVSGFPTVPVPIPC
jgi:hypothetical protein